MKKSTLEKKTAKLDGKKGGLSKKDLGAPDFDSLFDPAGEDGLSIIEGDDPQTVVDGETSEVLRRIKAEKKARYEKFRDQVDPEFYFCVCFQNRAQKEEFLAKVGWLEMGDKYLDGLAVARAMGIEIIPISLEVKKLGKAPKLMRGMEVIE